MFLKDYKETFETKEWFNLENWGSAIPIWQVPLVSETLKEDWWEFKG